METYPLAVENFVSCVKAYRWPDKPTLSDQAVAIVRADPEQVGPLVRAMTDELPRSSWCLGRALLLVPPEALPPLVDYAFASLVRGCRNDMAIAVLDFTRCNEPSALFPHLRALVPLAETINLGGLAAAWRTAPLSEGLYLKGVYEDEAHPKNVRRFALYALLEMRSEPLLKAVIANPPRSILVMELDKHLRHVGYTSKAGRLRKLTSDTVYYLRFADNYPTVSESWVGREHPTWRLPPLDTPAMRLGGVMDDSTCHCGCCGAAIHHLLTLDPPPDGVGVTDIERLTLGVCLSCLLCEDGMETAFYQHDARGMPVLQLGYSGPRIVQQSIVPPLMQTFVRLAAAPERVPWYGEGSRRLENHYRLGGSPGFARGPEYPDCPLCKRVMPLLLQLDSGLQTEGDWLSAYDGEWIWGDGGPACVFWCDECRVSAIFAQPL